ncbi:MAG: hypothetical protein H8E66_11065 [Planctomycetes bacterium]|nr:hypothetical protein [Planctomycetota bacterium]
MSDRSPTPAANRSWLRRLLNRLEVDQAVFFGIAARAWQFLAGPVTLILIAYFFSREVQGYYYTFWSLIALQSFFELSFQYVVINVASHEWQKLRLDDDGAIHGPEEAISRLSSLTRISLCWYGVAATLFWICVSAIGLVFFTSGEYSDTIAWKLPWLALVGCSAFVLWMTPFLGVLEGCNQVQTVYRFRFVRAVLGNLAVWACIPLGAGLWTPAIASFVQLVCEFYLIAVHYRRFFGVLTSRPTGPSIHWMSEVWPLQWRIGVKGLFCYFNTSLINPVIFYYYGEVTAGQVGMTWQVLSSLQAACSSWVRTRAARFGMLVAERDYDELNRIFIRLSTIALTVLCILNAAFILFDVLLFQAESRFADRLLAPLPTTLLALGLIATSLAEFQGIYIHAHKRSPYMIVSITAAATNGLLIWWLGRQYGVIGAAGAYLAMGVLFSLPFWTWAWYRCRAQWHLPESA